MHAGATGRAKRPPDLACRACREYGAVVVFTARLTVLGSLNMDISVTVPDLPVPGATVLGRAAVFAPGGKGANQAVAAARLAGDAGMSVAMIGCTGDDEFGRTLRSALRAEGVDDSGVRTVPGVPTGIAMITVDRAGENMITVAAGANHEVSPVDIANLDPVEPGRVEPRRRGRDPREGEPVPRRAGDQRRGADSGDQRGAGRVRRAGRCACSTSPRPRRGRRRPSSWRPAPTGWW